MDGEHGDGDGLASLTWRGVRGSPGVSMEETASKKVEMDGRCANDGEKTELDAIPSDVFIDAGRPMDDLLRLDHDRWYLHCPSPL